MTHQRHYQQQLRQQGRGQQGGVGQWCSSFHL